MESSAELAKIRMEMKDMGICVIIPTYNNDRTLERVIREVACYADNVIVVNDGSTDDTALILECCGDLITSVSCAPNKGKGTALLTGFRKALESGFDWVLTIDSDGQHFAEDIPKFIEMHKQHPRSVIMGARSLDAEGMPARNSFANRFSNFWFLLDTGIRMPDTQTGFRLYPLTRISNLHLFTSRFEFEVEVIVKLAWKDVPFTSVPVKVSYDPTERVSHFRPGPDFLRISLLNAWFCVLTLLYYLPRRLVKGGKILRLIKNEALNRSETNIHKAVSIGLGVFFGILPIWGFQLMIGIPSAILMRLNKVLFIAAANISIPPMIPLIIFVSYLMGRPFVSSEQIRFDSISDITLDNINDNFIQYVIGAIVLSVVAGLVSFLLAWSAFAGLRKNRPADID